ncbi:MAG: ribosome biogenesis GTP-binding protein YihA/YsxC [Oscillospiraceae bacterium]|jgi:GTP-binding protein|nr:ribosome biogenesis GTP-binding protein YihA/YsxC [Oscillospiraceae bacterium]
MNFNQTQFLAAYGTARQLPPSTKPEVVFSGRSNVGKSSLINKLCMRKNLARVSGQPGKTATINFYGLPELHLVDLPGYGYAKTSFAEKKRWAELAEGYFAQERSITLLVQLVDFRHPITELDRQMLSFCTERGLSFLVAETKCDKLNKTEHVARASALAEELAAYSFTACIQVSSQTGEGMEELRGAISAALS